jgi:hypothetical protein
MCTVEAEGGSIKRRDLAAQEREKIEPGARLTTKAPLSHMHEASASNPHNRAAKCIFIPFTGLVYTISQFCLQ